VLLEEEDDDKLDELRELDDDETVTVKNGLVTLFSASFSPSAENDKVENSSLIRLKAPFGVIQAL